MRAFIGLLSLCMLVAVMAVPPRFNNKYQQNFQRQEQAPSNNAPYPPSNSGPYPASGWKPQGAPFTLPARQQQPQDKYGPPPPQPDNSYGPPATESTVEPRTPESDVESLKSQKQVESIFKNTDRGLYYVYLPNGKLQRVVYMTSADVQNMAYTARVKYEDVDPVAAPIYSTINGAALTQAGRLIVA